MLYQLVEVKVAPNMTVEFLELLDDCRTILQKYGIELVNSFVATTGRMNTVYDIWKIADEAAVESAWADPAMQAILPRHQQIVLEETVTNMIRKI